MTRARRQPAEERSSNRSNSSTTKPCKASESASKKPWQEQLSDVQEAPAMTEDMLLEQQAAMAALGTTPLPPPSLPQPPAAQPPEPVFAHACSVLPC